MDLKRKMNFILLCLTLILVSGCATDKFMREKFGDNRPHILIDPSDGQRYIVKHFFFNNYMIEPIPTEYLKDFK